MAKKSYVPKIEEPQKVFKNLPDACIPYDTTFVGDIETKAGVRIDGKITGNITAAGNVTVGSDGNVEGIVTGKDVNIAGTITGNLNSFGTVQMLSGAKLLGDMQAASMAIEQGAYYKGKCTITENRVDNAEDYLGKLENKTQPKTTPASKVKTTPK